MTGIGRMLPQPLVSAAILALWLVLAASPGPGSVILGALVAAAIPLATQRFWPHRPRVVKPVAAIGLFTRVVGDILVANVEVARLVLGPVDRLRPRFVAIPLAINDPFVATLLGSIVSLTPGTVSIEIDLETGELLVHALDVGDDAQLIQSVKSRYEAPLKEIFGC